MHSSPSIEKNIKIAFRLNLSFSLLELIGGIFTNSIAILSDALHDFGDSCSLAISRYFQKLSQKKRNQTYSYGYRRFSLLGAMITSIVLLVGSLFIISESIQRLFTPQLANAQGMFLLAVIGIIVNGIAFFRLKKGHSLNEKAVGLHVLEDVLGRIAVLIGSIVMMFFEVPWLDAALSLGIAGYILMNVYHNLRDILRVILQGTPQHLSTDDLIHTLSSLEDVQSLYDVHLWTMDGEYIIASLHVRVKPSLPVSKEKLLKKTIKEQLKKLNIHHSTIEIDQGEEGETCDCE
jgi:cobalt-zinc-cadmium efflux system protein